MALAAGAHAATLTVDDKQAAISGRAERKNVNDVVRKNLVRFGRKIRVNEPIKRFDEIPVVNVGKT